MPWAGQIQKLDLSNTDAEGDIKYLKGCTKLKDVNFGCCKQITGNFEDFQGLSALLELSIGGCKKIDCKNALEVLPTMPWAGQIQKLDLSDTDAEGTQPALLQKILIFSLFSEVYSNN